MKHVVNLSSKYFIAFFLAETSIIKHLVGNKLVTYYKQAPE